MSVEKKVKDPRHRFGDRPDAYRVRDIDSMHVLMPHMLAGRCNNEAILNEVVDLTEIEKYLEKKNRDNPEFKYTFFHVICAAFAKTFQFRPKMNRFYAGDRLWERKDIVFSFVVKKKFTDNGAEGLAIVKIDRDSDVGPTDQIYEQVKKIVYHVRRENKQDGATDAMDVLKKLPRPILHAVMRFLHWLDFHGWYPKSLARDDPYFTSIFFTNLGSIKMHASYHHLAEWGTNSVFVVIDEKKKMPFYNDDGTYEMRDGLSIGVTIDERIADGVYFANTLKLFRRLIENPDLLDRPIGEVVDM